MNDDLVVQKILKLLENNTAFIGYALNGGIGTKINVRNTETGKTIQALSINVDSSGEVLVVKDSDDGKYKAVTFKAAQQTTERIIQIRKTKPIDDKKIVEYTDTDIEVFYLFVKLVDMGTPIPTQLQSTWIRKGSSCTQFVGAYERCNYASRATINGTSYTGLPYVPYSTLNNCLSDDLGRDAATPHGSGDENGLGLGYKIYSTKMTAEAEEQLLAALTSHDEYYDTDYRSQFGFASILDCGGAMYIQGWQYVAVRDPQTNEITKYFSQCEFSYLPGFTVDCTPEQQQAGYCDTRGFISSKAPLSGQEEPGKPSVNQVDNTWGHQYGWVNLPYEFKYKRHFPYNYLNGQNAQGSFVVFEINDDQTPTIPEGYFPWVPGCPSGGGGGPYNGTGGAGFNGGVPTKPKKRDMKLSTHKAEIWLGSSRKEEAIKIYELGASDLFSGMYNSFIIKAEETQIDIENRLKRGRTPSTDDVSQHEKFYENWNKNIIDLKIDPRVWVYIKDNIPHAKFQQFHSYTDPQNFSLQNYVNSLYSRTLNLSVISKKLQVIHLKLGLKPVSPLSNTDCKSSIPNGATNNDNDKFSSQSWEYQKTITIKIKDWKIASTSNTLDTSELSLSDTWNTDHIQRRFLTSFGTFKGVLRRDSYAQVLSRHNSNLELSEIVSGNHYEQYNYAKAKLIPENQQTVFNTQLYASNSSLFKSTSFEDKFRLAALSTMSWWELWDKTLYNKKQKRLSSIVGFDKNKHQILRSSKLPLGLNYSPDTNLGFPSFTNAVVMESYYEYLSTRPKDYLPSVIRGTRNKLEVYPFSSSIADRKQTLDTTGLNFYFADWNSRWSDSSYNNQIFIPPPSDYYYEGYNPSDILRTFYLDGVDEGYLLYYGNQRLDTRLWINNLWVQLLYDGSIKVDVDSYDKVEFNLPSNPSQYIKYTTFYLFNNSEYNFSTIPETNVTLETVLTPGVLDVAKQVTITKPTNVDLDPNLSFLVYAYPFVEVTKKKKEI